jgi:hypothetical protein
MSSVLGRLGRGAPDRGGGQDDILSLVCLSLLFLDRLSRFTPHPESPIPNWLAGALDGEFGEAH